MLTGLFYGLTAGAADLASSGNGGAYSYDPNNRCNFNTHYQCGFNTSYQLLLTFPDTVQQPLGSFIQGNINNDQLLYTVSSTDSLNSAGALISMTTTGVVNVLHTFNGEMQLQLQMLSS